MSNLDSSLRRLSDLITKKSDAQVQAASSTLSDEAQRVADLTGSTAASALAAHTGMTTTAHGGIVASTDARLTDARTPTAHKASHATGGSDALTAANVGAEVALGNPASNGYILSSTAAGVRSWVAQVSTLAWSAITGKPTTVATSGLTDAVATSDSRLSDARTPVAHAASHHATGGSDALTAANVGAEASLGNPASNGYILSSTTAGVRSWVAQVSTLAWSAITGKPTTVATSGLTDAVATSDSRLSDARTPTAHTQAFTTVTGTLADTQLSANVPRLNAANTFVTGQAVGSGVGDAQFVFDGGAGKVRDMLWSSGGLPRWILRATSTAETGSDVGSDFQIISRDDYGNFKAAVATITRSNSAVALAGHVAVGGGLDVGTAMGATTGMIRGKTDTGYIDILVTSVDRDGRVGFAVGSAYGSLVSQTATGSASRALAVTALGTWIGKTSGLTGAGDLDVAGKLNVDGVTTLGDTLTVQLATTPAASLSATGGIVLSDDASRGINIAVGSPSPTGRPMLEFTKSRGTLAAPVAVENDDLLGTITAKAYDAAAVPTTQANGYIAFAVAGVVSAGVIPVAIDFYTSATNAANRARRLRVMPTGSVLIGKATGLTGAGDLDVAGALNVDGTTTLGNATTLGDGTTDTSLAISGGAAKCRDLYFQTGTSNRWIVRVSSDAESGSNAGSNFQVISRTDGGLNISTVLTLTRSTGAASFAGAVAVTGTLTATGGIVGEAWTNITTFSGDWVAYGGTTYAPPGYWKDALGIVHLRGLVKYGTAPITLPSSPFTLPTGYKPQYASVFACMTNEAIGRVDVLANGQVMVRSSSSVYVSLDGISFRAA